MNPGPATPAAAPPISWRELESRRRQLVASLAGTVLEIGAGRGANLTALRPGVRWIGVEPDATRHTQLTTAARAAGQTEPPLAVRAEDVPMPDASADAVLATQVLCSVDDPHAALQEVCRVLRPHGRVVLVEHVAAPPGTWTHRVQRMLTPVSRRLDHGCRWDRDTYGVLLRSPLQVTHAEHRTLRLGPFAVPYLLAEASAP